MAGKIETWWNNYREKQKKKSLFSQIMDYVTILLIILLLIPTTRMKLKEWVSRVTMTAPKTKDIEKRKQLETNDLTWQVVTYEGERVSLEALTDEVIFLNFWATWCPPCVAEMPEIQSLYDEYKNDVAFLFVSNETQQKVHTFLQNNGYSIPVVQPVSAPPDALAASSIPTTYIIDKNQRIALAKTGAAKWSSPKFTRLLDELIGE